MDSRQNQSVYPFIRNNYYPGKLLHAGDFINEQNYGNSKLEFLNRKFHGCGIIDGLKVQVKENGILHITAGSAIDSQGRILVVPQDVDVGPEDLEGFQGEQEGDFILGIRYAERVAEEERSFLSKEEAYQKARIAETYALGAYSVEGWKRLCGMAGTRDQALTEERVLFQDEAVRLVLRTPKVVPADSIFRCCIEAQAFGKGSVSIGWRCRARLQGAYFAATGRPFQMLEEKPSELSGSVRQEWEFYTEEARKLPVMLELSGLEILSESAGTVEAETCQVCIEAVTSFEDAARKYLEESAQAQTMEWLPLARLRLADGLGIRRTYFVTGDSDVRLMAVRPREEEIFKRALEENGIVDIRWRSLLKGRQLLPPGAPPPGGRQPQVQELPREQPLEPPLEQPPMQEPSQLGEGILEYIHSGVTVIPVPKRYRRGQPLFSTEISHGFPGERVFLWCGRVYEERNYAYWERSKIRYSVLYGEEGLFSDGWDSGWEIEKQAMRQDATEGTFRIAITLAKGRRKNRCKEVAIAWIAVKAL